MGAGVVLTAALGRAVQEPVHFDQRPDGPFAARLVEGVQNRKRSCEGFEREYGSQLVCATAQGHAVERAIDLEQPTGGEAPFMVPALNVCTTSSCDGFASSMR